MSKIQRFVEILDKYCTVSELCYKDYESVCERAITEAKAEGIEVSCDSGISKVVFIIQGEPVVLKIPYRGQRYDDEYDTEAEEYIPSEIEEFYCAGHKEVGDFKWDYCALECALYELIVKNGYDDFFAKEEKYGEIQGVPIYVQDRAITQLKYSATKPSKLTNETRRALYDKCCSEGWEYPSEEWVQDFIDTYGEEAYANLNSFCEDNDIGDIHGGNVGYINDLPVIFDYSGFWD